MLLSIGSLFLFSFRIGVPILGVMLVLMWVELTSRIKRLWIKVAGWAIIILAVVVILYLTWYWVDAVLWWDTLVTIRTSNRVQLHIEALPDWLGYPFIIIYGILQPVLPAAIAAPAPWIWRSLGIFRSFGWYAMLPLLVYALIAVWRMKPSTKKRWMVVITLLVWVWIMIASTRAGGDQWDNPRYRTIFLPWMGLVTGWAIVFARKIKDRWLVRSLIMEGIFLVFFTAWYVSRYYPSFNWLEFYASVGVIIVLCLGVIIVGLVRDGRRRKDALQDRVDD
jgi:peptidoglycan/LPS O-acetylase OafA/YrhL